jgi:hypothetical protein
MPEKKLSTKNRPQNGQGGDKSEIYYSIGGHYLIAIEKLMQVGNVARISADSSPGCKCVHYVWYAAVVW